MAYRLLRYLVSLILIHAYEWLQCGGGFYQNIQQNICQKCDANCSDCAFSLTNQSQPTQSLCLKCINGFYYDSLNGQCQPTCPVSTRKNDSLNICENCLSQHCDNCDKDPSICTQCKSDFILIGDECQIDIQSFNTSQNSIMDIYQNQIECTNLVDNSFYNNQNLIQYAFFDEDYSNLYIFSTINVYKYDTLTLSLQQTGSFPYNGFIRDCGFYLQDKSNFYCTARPNFLIQYDKNLLNQTLLTTFTGFFPNYSNIGGSFPAAYYGRLYQRYYTGLITSFLGTGIEVYRFEDKSKVLYKIQSYAYTNQNYAFLIDLQGFIMFDQARDQVFFKDNLQTENLILKGQTGYLYGYDTLDSNNILLLYKFGASVCNTSLLKKNQLITLSTDCYTQNTPWQLTKYSFPSINTNYKEDQLLVIYQNIYGVMLVYDYSQGPQNVNLVFGKLNYTQSFQYVGKKSFIHLNMNHQLSLITILGNGQVTEVMTPPLASYIFHMSYAFQFLPNRIILANSKQAIAIKYQLKPDSDQSSALNNFLQFISQNNNNLEINRLFAEEPLLNYDYLIKAFYDTNLQLYILLKNFQIRIKYQRGSIQDQNEIYYKIEQNSGLIVEAEYIQSIKRLIIVTYVEQLILSIPDLKLISRHQTNIIGEKWSIFYQASQLITCAFDKSNYLQYLFTDLSTQIISTSEVYMAIQDYFIGYDKVVILNNTDIYVVTLSTSQVIKQKLNYQITLDTNLFYSIGSTYYLALYQKQSPPQMQIYNLDQIDLSSPSSTLTYPNVVLSSQMFDYYNNQYSLYIIQSNGIYAYELDSNNVFIQQNFYSNTATKTIKLQSKIIGPSSFSKVLVVTSLQELIIIDKVTKTFSLISTQAQILNISMLINSMKQEILLIIHISQTKIFSQINNQYKEIQQIQGACQGTLRFLDTSEIFCPQPLKNDTFLIPVNKFKTFSLNNYAQHLTSVSLDKTQQFLSVNIQNNVLQVLKYNLLQEQIAIQYQTSNSLISFVFYDYHLEILLFVSNDVSLYSYKQGQVNPTLLVSGDTVQWYYVAIEKQIILVNLSGQLYSINYSTGSIIYQINLFQAVLLTPPNTPIVSYELIDDNIYLYFTKARVLRCSFTDGIKAFLSLNLQDIQISGKRIDKNFIVFTNQVINLYSGDNFIAISTVQFTTLIDTFRVYHVTNRFVFCHPQSIQTGYFIDINSLTIYPIVFRSTLYSIGFDESTNRIVAITIDNILSIYDQFNYNNPKSFILQELSDDLAQKQQGSNQGVQINLKVLFNLDCFIFSQAEYIYFYSLSKNIILHIIRTTSTSPIIDFWILENNILLYYDENGIYYYEINQIVQLQTKFHSTRYLLNEILIHNPNLDGNNPIGLTEIVANNQLNIYQNQDGLYLKSYQLRKNFLTPVLMNSKLITTMNNNTQKIIIRQNVIYTLDSSQTIIDSFIIPSMNVMALLSPNLINSNNIFIINYDKTIIQVDILKKQYITLSINLQNVQFTVVLADISLIFQYNESAQQNELMCLNTSTLQFLDMSNSLNSYNLNKIFKDYQKISNQQILAFTVDGYLCYLNFQGCSFSSVPTLVINQSFFYFYFDNNFQRLFVQRKSIQSLQLIQNNMLIETSLLLPSLSDNRIKISEDLTFYIIHSQLFIYIYTTIDLKLKVQINQLFSQSEITDVFFLSLDFLLVTTNTDIFSFYIIQDRYYLAFTYPIELPKILSYKINSQIQQTSLIRFADLSIFSLKGIVKLNLPIFSSIQNSSKKCFYSLPLDSANKQKTAPLIYEKINMLSYLNQNNKNIQIVDSIVFKLEDKENIQKLSTIPNKIHTLVLDSNKLPNLCSIIIDQSFNLINTVSNNVLLQNSELQFQESINSAPIQNPIIDISNKEIVYFQNINFVGYRKSYYFTLNSNNLFKVEKLTIIGFQIDSSNNNAISFFNFEKTEIIILQNLILKDLNLSDNFTFFNIRDAKQITIESLTLENITCQQLVIFDLGQSTELRLNSISVKNINCQYFQLIQSYLVTDISLQSIFFSGVNAISTRQTIIIQSVFRFQIQEFQITNCKGMKGISILKYSQDNTDHGVNEVKIDNMKIDQSSDHISQQNLRNLQAQNSNTQMVSIQDCQNLSIKNLIIDELTLSSSNFFSFNSLQIDLSDIYISNIQTTNQILATIRFDDGNDIAIENFNLLNTQNVVLQIQNGVKINLIKSTINNNQIQSQQQTNGLLSISNVLLLNVIDSHLENNKIYKQAKGLLNLFNVQKFTLNNNKFVGNIGMKSSGTCLYIINQQLDDTIKLKQNPSLIEKCSFTSNESVSEVGGAIFISEQNIQIQDSTFLQNKALIGGAIKISSVTLLPDFFIDILNKKQSSNQFNDNQALLYGENVGYFPQNVKAVINKNRFFLNHEKANILDFQSNYYIDDIILYILDNEGNQINFPTEKLSLENEILQQEFLKYQFVIDQKANNNIFVSQSQIILTNFQFFQVNVTLITAPQSVNQLSIKTQGTTPIIQLDQTGFTVAQQYMEIELVIHSRGCERGDYLSKINNLVYCLPCPYGQYSLDFPDLSNNEQTLTCKFCPTSSKSCKGNNIQLKNGYWREDSFTDQIYKCKDFLSSCKAEDPNSINLCSKGYVGPLCETCDTLGTVWESKYALNSSKECSECSQFVFQYFTLLGFLALSAGYLVCIVFQNIRCSQNKILRQFSEKIIGISLGSEIDFSRNSVLVKILMNFFQIYIILDGSGFSLPYQSSQFSFLGDPTLNLATSIDCILEIKSENRIILYRIIIKILSIAILYMICVGAIIFRYILDTSKSKKFSYNIAYTSMALKLIYLYAGIGIFTDVIKALSCVKIGSKRYRVFDKRIECSPNISDDTVVYVFATLIVVIIAIVIPLLLLIQIKKFSSQNRTTSIHVLKSYNFLFQEYKPSAVYWELVKVMLKYSIIFVINVFDQDVFSKIQLALLFLVIYNVALLKVQPYKCQFFNKTDLHSMITCQVTLISSACIFTANNELIQVLLLTIIIGTNTFFLVLTLFSFLKGSKIQIDHQNKNPCQKLFYKLMFKMQRYLQIQVVYQKNRLRALKLWMNLKKKIIQKNDNVFAGYLIRRVQENRLFEKQLNFSSILKQNDEKQSKFQQSQFKIELGSGSKLNQQSNLFTLPSLIQEQEDILLKDKQKSLFNANNNSSISVFMRNDLSQKKINFVKNYPTTTNGDEIKQNNEFQVTQQGEDKYSITDESQEENIKIYKSPSIHSNNRIFNLKNNDFF